MQCHKNYSCMHYRIYPIFKLKLCSKLQFINLVTPIKVCWIAFLTLLRIFCLNYLERCWLNREALFDCWTWFLSLTELSLPRYHQFRWRFWRWRRLVRRRSLPTRACRVFWWKEMPSLTPLKPASWQHAPTSNSRVGTTFVNCNRSSNYTNYNIYYYYSNYTFIKCHSLKAKDQLTVLKKW